MSFKAFLPDIVMYFAALFENLHKNNDYVYPYRSQVSQIYSLQIVGFHQMLLQEAAVMGNLHHSGAY